MKELKEQIAGIILSTYEVKTLFENEAFNLADQILSLPIAGGLWVEKECNHKKEVLNSVVFSGSSRSTDFGGIIWCSTCQGTGIIRRPANLQDYLDLFDIVKSECISCEGRLLPDGERLVWKE